MNFFHFKENHPTRNYEVIATGFTTQPSKRDPADSPTFRQGLESAKDITALFSSIILSSIGYGMIVALVAFTMGTHVKNEILISISSATQIGAGVMFGRFLPLLGRKIGMVNSIYLASTISAISAILMYFYVDYFLWIAIIFFFGGSLFIAGVIRQTIMIGLAPPHTKAIIISVGGMLVAIGNGFGPIFLETIQTSHHFASYGIAALAYALSMLPLSRLKKTEAKVREEKKIGIWRYLQASPKIMLAGFCVNYSLSSASAFLIIYGLKTGLPESEAALLYSVLLFGTVFSVPLGYLTDIVNRRILMISCAALSLICVLALYLNENPANIHALLFITFGCMTGMKLPAVVLINEKYKPTQRLAVNSAFTKFSLIGNIVGIFTTGTIMKLSGPSGLWLSIVLALTFYLIFCSGNYILKIIRGELVFKKFSFSNKSMME